MPSAVAYRVFKTAGFSKAAKKARICDSALCAAIRQVMAGQASDLGGGVLTERQVSELMRRQHFVETCHDDEE
jgi:hypothetical protein